MPRFDYDTLRPKTAAIVGFLQDIRAEMERFAQMPLEELTTPERDAIAQLCATLIIIWEQLPDIESVSEELLEERKKVAFDRAFPMWADPTIMH